MPETNHRACAPRLNPLPAMGTSRLMVPCTAELGTAELTCTGAGGNSVSENVFEVLFSVLVINTGVLEPTGDGVTVKLAVVAPELTVTEAGAEAELLLLESATLVLLAGATLRVTVQVEVAGAVMLAGLHVKFVGTGVGGSKVRANV